MLKQECLKFEKIDKGQYVDLEYAKNILLSFLESNDRVQLVPVVSCGLLPLYYCT